MSDRPYPPIPKEAKTGLLVFGAYFKGANDGQHLHNAGLDCTVVDNNQELLDAMKPHYPDSWDFVCADAFEFASTHNAVGRQWDVVSVDPSRPEEPRVLEAVGLWVALARMMVVIGHRVRFDSWWEQVERPPDSSEPWVWMYTHK